MTIARVFRRARPDFTLLVLGSLMDNAHTYVLIGLLLILLRRAALSPPSSRTGYPSPRVRMASAYLTTECCCPFQPATRCCRAARGTFVLFTPACGRFAIDRPEPALQFRPRSAPHLE